METELASTSGAAAAVVIVEAEAAEGFGTRPSSGRPHSIRLDGGPIGSGARSVSRGLDVLLGIGIGAVAMYYLDPTAGSRRRARAESSPTTRLLAVVLGTALTALGGRRRDPVGAALGVLGSALLAGGARKGLRAVAERSAKA
jgi:hypothetical protein